MISKLTRGLWRAVTLLLLTLFLRLILIHMFPGWDNVYSSYIGHQSLNDFIYFFSEDIVRVVITSSLLKCCKYLAGRYPSLSLKKLTLILQALLLLALGKCVDEFTFPTLPLFEWIYIIIVSIYTFYKLWNLTHHHNRK